MMYNAKHILELFFTIRNVFLFVFDGNIAFVLLQGQLFELH